jgi:phospholipid N-methyltransferase
MTSTIRVNDQIAEAFCLNSAETVREYFPDHKNNALEKVKALWNRLVHFISTGVWIDNARVYSWAIHHSESKISDLFVGKFIQKKLARCETTKMWVPKPSLLQRIASALLFLKQNILHPHIVGSLFPSSTFLAKKIVRQIPKDPSAPPRRILEVGPGTGAFTRQILKRMNPNDKLVLVEFNEKFVEELKETFGHIPNVKICKGDVLLHESAKPYDYVVSGLSLNAFKFDFVQRFFQKIQELSAPEAKFSYFEYPWIPKVTNLFLNRTDRMHINQIMEKKASFHQEHFLDEDLVWSNFPPARIRHHCLHQDSV